MTQNKSKTLHTTDNRDNWCSRDPVIEVGAPYTPQFADIEELRGFGKVSLWGYPSGDSHQGWRCKVEIAGAVVGVSGYVQSEWRHQTPEAAVAECLERCRSAFGKR